jgi:hypothetical protein
VEQQHGPLRLGQLGQSSQQCRVPLGDQQVRIHGRITGALRPPLVGKSVGTASASLDDVQALTAGRRNDPARQGLRLADAGQLLDQPQPHRLDDVLGVAAGEPIPPERPSRSRPSIAVLNGLMPCSSASGSRFPAGMRRSTRPAPPRPRCQEQSSRNHLLAGVLVADGSGGDRGQPPARTGRPVMPVPVPVLVL